MRKCTPDAQILPLDYDPDALELCQSGNRLQMLIMNVKERSVDTVALPDVGQRSPVETMNRKQKNADNKKQKVSDFGLDKNRNHKPTRRKKGQAETSGN